MPEYDTALIDLAGVGPKVWGEFTPDHRWNGWLCPYIDALSVVLTLDDLNSDADYYQDYGTDYHFEDDGTLVLIDRQWQQEDPETYEPERLTPNEDGLYSLGAYSWVWSYATWTDDPYHRGE